MDQREFHALVAHCSRPVILVEGTRDLPDTDRPRLVALAVQLATNYPHALFRTGNAVGSDEAFAEGVAAVNPGRLQFVLPYKGHRSKAIDDRSYRIGLNELTLATTERATYLTAESSPQYASMMEASRTVPRLKTKVNYLLRDTIKVTGDTTAGLAPATVGIFYVNPDDPMKGGTGHTIRVCMKEHVPIVFQFQWQDWIPTPTQEYTLRPITRPTSIDRPLHG